MSVSGGPNLSEDGLVLYLDVANNKSYPRTGTSWIDLSGNNNSGSLINGPTFSGANNGSIVFDGINQYAEIAHSTTLRVYYTTVMMWFKRNGVGTAGTGSPSSIIFTQQNSSSFFGHVVGLQDGTTLFANLKDGPYTPPFSGGTSTTIIGNVVPDNTWQHITFTISNEFFSHGIKLYQNGIFITQGSFSTDALSFNENSIRLLDSLDPFWGIIAGSIGSVSIYNRALSAQEVLQNFNAQRSRFGV